MGRIAINTREVRSLGRMLEGTAKDMNRTTKRVRDRHYATQLNTARDPRVNSIRPGVNIVSTEVAKAARAHDRLGELAVRTAHQHEAADKLKLKARLGRPQLGLAPWSPFPTGISFPLPSEKAGFPPALPKAPGDGWRGLFGDGLRAGSSALDRARGGLNNFKQSAGNVGNKFLAGARGLLGKASNWADNIKGQVGDKVDGVKDKLSSGFNSAVSGLRSAFSWGKDKLTSLIKDTWNGIWTGLTTTLKNAIAGINTLAKAAVFTGKVIVGAIGRFGVSVLDKLFFHTSRDGRSSRQSREHQRSDDRRGRSQGGDGSNGNFNHDWAGRSILDRYLTGGGDWAITHDPEWTEYMMANASLDAQLDDYVEQDLDVFLASGEDELVISETTAVTIENGEGIVGYQYLHGTNANAGGFERTNHFRRRADGSVEVTSTYTWNDIIDPNPQYSTDRWKSKVAEVITLGQADDYSIHITWEEAQVFDGAGG